ncbi:unnamed protein product [Chrysodeixis includens]|uniref:Uncharacterized protein n=1 Tax=Chrysodeixis includens TaxID=689277 RepID=A0A9N8KTP9_CHRIL|nr:unnamed protein product [Chrysodeixis includens]
MHCHVFQHYHHQPFDRFPSSSASTSQATRLYNHLDNQPQRLGRHQNLVLNYFLKHFHNVLLLPILKCIVTSFNIIIINRSIGFRLAPHQPLNQSGSTTNYTTNLIV